MGQRTPTETLFGIIAAFVEERTWSQAGLARRLETRPETIRKRLGELQAGGFKLERSEDHPHVYWSVPKNWFPGVLPFKEDEVADLLRLLGRAPKGMLRERLFNVVVSRLSNLGRLETAMQVDAVRPPSVSEDEDRWLSLVEDAAAKKVTLKMRYYSANRRGESWRHVSVHRIDLGTRTHFVGTCHEQGALRRFRVSGVLEAKLNELETFRSVLPAQLAAFDEATFGNFHHEGPALLCAFTVRDPESSWVTRNLPDERITHRAIDGGVRYEVHTSALPMLARYVVGLGDAAVAETPELRERVARIAHGALDNALDGAEASPRGHAG